MSLPVNDFTFFTMCLSVVPPSVLHLPRPDDLSELLAEGTKESHDRAENCQFVKDFLRGRIQRELFKVSLQGWARMG